MSRSREKTVEFYVIQWPDSDMVGYFKKSNLEQIMNVHKGHEIEDLKILMNMYDATAIKIRFLKNHKELNNLRKKRGIPEKPLLF